MTFRKSGIPIAALTMILAAGLCTTSRAQSGRAGAFLRLGLGAQAKAMGDAYSAMARGVESNYYNPAGLPFLKKKQVLASYRFLALDRQFTYIGFGMPIQPKAKAKVAETESGEDEPEGTAEAPVAAPDSSAEEQPAAKAINGGFSLAWLRAGVSNIDGRDGDGQHFDDLSNSENAFIFAFALNPLPRFSIGLAAKVLWNRFPQLGIENQTIAATGVGFDLGLMFLPTDWLSIGVVAKELNSKYRWNNEDLYGAPGSDTVNDFPKVARYGIAVTPPQFNMLTVAIDYEQLYDEKLFASKIDDRIHIGALAVFPRDVLIAAGFDNGSLTAGAGYKFAIAGRPAQINYAYTAPGDRPEDEHIFTWIFEF